MSVRRQPPQVGYIEPIYPFNAPGQAVALHTGPAGGFGHGDTPTTVELQCDGRLRLSWQVPTLAPRSVGAHVKLLLRRSYGDATADGVLQLIDRGWLNFVRTVDDPRQVQSLVAHWFNVPDFGDQFSPATTSAVDVIRLTRWEFKTRKWTVAFQGRPDHKDIFRSRFMTPLYVMTHVMSLSRSDGAPFAAGEAALAMDAIHVGLSFALGQWVAPALQAGLGAHKKVIWEQWAPFHCDKAKAASAWWYEEELGSLGEFLKSVVKVSSYRLKWRALRFRFMLAITCLQDKGFVEQRITAGTAGLEHVMWEKHVLTGGMAERTYQRTPAHALLRPLLQAASVDTNIDKSVQPAMAAYARRERRRQGRNLDAVEVLTQVRNQLVHPKHMVDRIYDHEDLVTEVWSLTSHYLVLLILHELGYGGTYRDSRKAVGWSGNTQKVPWA